MKKIMIPIAVTLLLVITVAGVGMYKFNYLSTKQGYDVDGNKIEKNLTTNTDILFGVDQGSLSLSDTSGFKNYTNAQLGVSFLTPDSWDGQVGIGGLYTIMPRDIGTNTVVDISARTTTFDFLTNGNSPKNPNIKDYMNMRAAFLIEENIGKDLKVNMEKTTFAGQEGYKIDYTYTLAADVSKQFSTEYFTVIGDSIYSLTFGGLLSEKETYQDTFDTMKDSYTIMK